jgi:hypothetical protein
MSDAVIEGADAPPDTVFVPRDEQASILAAALGSVRMTEGERRWGVAIGRLSGWLVAAVMVVPLGYTLAILRNRPVPQDRIFVSIMHSDGTTEAAKPIEDLTPSEHEAAVTEFVFNYVDYRISYTWEDIQRNYDRTRFTTLGDAQTEYVKSMTEGPEQPTMMLGKLGERRGPNAFEASYTLRIKAPDGRGWLPDMPRRVQISLAQFPGLPAEVARRLDPLKMVVIRWDERPARFDPTQPGGKQ